MTDPKDNQTVSSAEPIRIDDPRVFFASERTLLAWIRTSIAMMGLGFLVARFGLFIREMMIMRGDHSATTPKYSLLIGVGMVVLGIVMVIAAAYSHYSFLRLLEIRQFAGSLRRWMSVVIAVALGLLGIAMTFYLLSVR
jgi:putative membrane protein